MKIENTLKVFRALRRQGELSRKDLEDCTGLSWGSISHISAELIQRGILIARKSAVTTGRPPETLVINPQVALSLGIDVNNVGLSFNVVNLAGNSVYSRFFPLEDNKKDYLLALLTEETAEIVSSFRILGISLAMQGKIDRQAGVSLRTNFFEGWKNIPLVSLFENRFGIPTRLYHDPEALLAFHLATDPRLKNALNGIVIRVDDGIGMAQLIAGEPYETATDAACELGHTISVPGGRVCPCGKKGCLEMYSSLRGMKHPSVFPDGITTEAFFSLFAAGDPLANRVMDEACDRMGLAISNLFTLYNPAFVLLDGIVTAQCPAFFDRVHAAAVSYSNGECNLLKSNYRKDAAAIGACLLTIDANLENYLF